MKNFIFYLLAITLVSCSDSLVKDIEYKSFDSNDIWICTMPEKNISEIESNGKTLANPMSNIVVVYYFKDGQQLPSLKNFTDFNKAKESIVEMNPIASFYKYPNGTTSVIELDIFKDSIQ